MKNKSRKKESLLRCQLREREKNFNERPSGRRKEEGARSLADVKFLIKSRWKIPQSSPRELLCAFFGHENNRCGIQPLTSLPRTLPRASNSTPSIYTAQRHVAELGRRVYHSIPLPLPQAHQ
jgi:hypothetical protein